MPCLWALFYLRTGGSEVGSTVTVVTGRPLNPATQADHDGRAWLGTAGLWRVARLRRTAVSRGQAEAAGQVPMEPESMPLDTT